MLNVGDWLHGLGLAHYADLFRANDIDGDLLAGLTGDDLKDMGIVVARPSQEAAGGDRRPCRGAREQPPPHAVVRRERSGAS